MSHTFTHGMAEAAELQTNTALRRDSSVAVIAEGPYVVPVFTVPKLPRACGGILQAGSPWHDDELMDPSWIILRARGGPSPQHRDSFVP